MNCGTTRAASKGNNSKEKLDKKTTERSFSELAILVVKENGALSETDVYYCTYSFRSRLDLGGRALHCVGHYDESVRLMQGAWREIGVSLCALLHRAIARSDTRCVARALTCLNSVKLPARAFIKVKVYTEGSQDRTRRK